MAEKNTAQTANETKVPNRQVNATIPGNVYDDLEGYAFGTRRTVTALTKDIVLEWVKANAAEISARKV